jgi:hypothetical protein
VLDLPVTIEGEAGIHFHIVHSDSDRLAYLAGLIISSLDEWDRRTWHTVY